MKYIPLEDEAEDVLSKALASRGLTRRDIPAGNKERLLFLHSQLGLDTEALEGLSHYSPKVSLPKGVKQHVFPFYSTSLNIWTLDYKESFVMIDTGQNPGQFQSALSNAISSSGHPRLEAILLTHGHGDHTGGLPASPDCSVIQGDLPEFPLNGHLWRAFPIPGHTEDSVCYFTSYRGQPLLFTGDALFAGSMGKMTSGNDISLTLDLLCNMLESLPGKTLILPGHGPASSITMEWEHNPFLKGRKRQ